MDHPHVSYVLYADDIQLYTICDTLETATAIKRLEMCISDVNDWLNEHELVLNASKTEFIVFHPKAMPPLSLSLKVGDATITSSAVVRNLGVYLDSTLTMEKHVSHICKNAFFYLRNISKARHCLTPHTSRMLIHALALSRIDYCSSLLHGISSKSNAKINKVLKYSIRLSEGLNRRISPKEYLKRQGWLLFPNRVKLRLSSIIFTAFHKGTPKPLSNLLTPANTHTTRTLRSHSDGSLSVLRTRTKIGDLAFRAISPTIWNTLPANAKTTQKLSTFRAIVHKHFLDLS
jgi:hypothetical protein